MDAITPGARRHMMPGNWLPIFGFVWAACLWLTVIRPGLGLWVSMAGFVAILLAVWWYRRVARRWILPLTVAVLLASSVTAIGSLSLSLWQYGIIASTGILLSALLTHRQDEDDPFGTRLINVSIALSLFFSWLVFLSFGIGIFFVWPWWWLAIGGGVMTGISAVILWSAGRVPWKTFRLMVPLTVVVGAEITIAIWWLPTVIYVGSIVATTIIMLWFQVLRHVWQGSWQTGRGRRYLLVGLSVCAIMLVSARWT